VSKASEAWGTSDGKKQVMCQQVESSIMDGCSSRSAT
jgi:hypothetical protein